MRYFPRLDKVQKDIVARLEERGYSVLSIASVGSGAPDIVVGWLDKGRRYCVLIELKTPKHKTKPATLEAQQRFAKRWKGPLYTCNSLPACLAALQDATKRKPIAWP